MPTFAYFGKAKSGKLKPAAFPFIGTFYYFFFFLNSFMPFVLPPSQSTSTPAR